jgi:hypothetical protein
MAANLRGRFVTVPACRRPSRNPAAMVDGAPAAPPALADSRKCHTVIESNFQVSSANLLRFG